MLKTSMKLMTKRSRMLVASVAMLGTLVTTTAFTVAPNPIQANAYIEPVKEDMIITYSDSQVDTIVAMNDIDTHITSTETDVDMAVFDNITLNVGIETEDVKVETVQERRDRKAAEAKAREAQAIASNSTQPTDFVSQTVDGIALQYSAPYYVSDNPLTASKGVVYFNGHKETYYSQRVLPGNGLNIPGRHVADDGTVRDGDGYICVASDLSYLSRGSVVLTSLGPAKVYDTGCAYGVIDIYVNW